jgi:hypothetical protein
MSSRSLRPALIVLATSIGAAICLPDSLAAQAQQTRQISVVQEMAPVGLAPGQTLRYTWANLTTPDSREHFEPIRIVVRLLADDATVLAQDAAEAVGAGRFQVFDFSRGAIGRTGDATTAALPVRVEATVVGHSKYNDVVLKRGVADFDDGVEIIDEATGATTVAFGHGSNEMSLDDTAGKEKAVRDGFQIISAGKDGFVGIIPGQSLRITSANPIPGTEAGRRIKPLFAFTVYDLDGRPIVEGDAVALEPGQSHSFEVPYSALGVSAGRVQVRVEARRYFNGFVSRFSAGGRALAPVALEIVDAASGRTTVHLSQKPKEIVVVGSKIDP